MFCLFSFTGARTVEEAIGSLFTGCGDPSSEVVRGGDGEGAARERGAELELVVGSHSREKSSPNKPASNWSSSPARGAAGTNPESKLWTLPASEVGE
jgi:hypothetical protein